ncbi:hypothetical protein GOBAR_AA23735 [Gossypium barbadense]|nr:hypothetical protein GOBAR_AA23735 [Gossypium barbadense]
MAILLTKVVEMIEFGLGQIIFDGIVKFIEKIYNNFFLLYPSLIFQVLYTQNLSIVSATKQYEKVVLELKFLHKWFEGKHIVNEPTKEALGFDSEKDAKEYAPFQEVSTVASTKSVPSSMRKRITNELNSSIEFNKRHCDNL